MEVTRRPFGALRGGRGCAVCCACVARCCVTIVPPRRCPLFRSAGAGYRLPRNLLRLPHPPFSGGACVSGVYCRRRVLVAALVPCVLVSGHAVRVLVACVYPYQWRLRSVCGLYGYYVICYPLPPYMQPYARIYAGVALCPLLLFCPLCVVYVAYMRIHSASARVGSCPA